MTDKKEAFMRSQPAAERRFLLERMPDAIARAVEVGRLARAEALKAEYEFMMEIDGEDSRGIRERGRLETG
jgi:hypothetical protein